MIPPGNFRLLRPVLFPQCVSARSPPWPCCARRAPWRRRRRTQGNPQARADHLPDQGRRRPLRPRLEGSDGRRDVLRDQPGRQHPAAREDRRPDRLRRPLLLRLVLVRGPGHLPDPRALRRPRRHQRRPGLRRHPPRRREHEPRRDRLLDRAAGHPGRLRLQRGDVQRGLRAGLLLAVRRADRRGLLGRGGARSRSRRCAIPRRTRRTGRSRSTGSTRATATTSSTA